MSNLDFFSQTLERYRRDLGLTLDESETGIPEDVEASAQQELEEEEDRLQREEDSDLEDTEILTTDPINPQSLDLTEGEELDLQPLDVDFNTNESAIVIFTPAKKMITLGQMIEAISFEPTEKLTTVPFVLKSHSYEMNPPQTFARSYFSIDDILRLLLDPGATASELFTQVSMSLRAINQGYAVVNEYGSIVLTQKKTQIVDPRYKFIKDLCDDMYAGIWHGRALRSGESVNPFDVELELSQLLHRHKSRHRIIYGRIGDYQITKSNITDWMGMQNLFSYITGDGNSVNEDRMNNLLAAGCLLFAHREITDTSIVYHYPVDWDELKYEYTTSISRSARIAFAVFGVRVLQRFSEAV